MLSKTTQKINEATVLLVGGLARGGTTAIVDVINECPDAAVMAEYRLIDLVSHLKPVLDYEAMIQEVVREFTEAENGIGDSAAADDLVRHYPGFETPGLKHTLRFPTSARFSTLVSNVVRTSLDKPKASIIGSKSPGAMLGDGGGELAKLFPKVRYVAMLRSPLDQINSSMNRRNRAKIGVDRWHHDTVEDAIGYYIDTVVGLVALKLIVGDDLLFIKYEDMLHNSGPVFDQLFTHLGSDWRPTSAFTFKDRGSIDVLSSYERQAVEKALGFLIKQWDGAALTGCGAADLRIFDPLLPRVPEKWCPIGGGKKQAFLAKGWSAAEMEGIWTDDDHAVMLFGSASLPPSLMRLEMTPFLAAGEPLGVEVLMNGNSVGRTLLCPGAGIISAEGFQATPIADWSQRTTLWIGPIEFNQSEPNRLEFRLSGVRSPLELGSSPDSRRLGMRVSGIQFVPVEKSGPQAGQF